MSVLVGDTQVNKFEQVWSLGHQMSQAVEGPQVNTYEQVSSLDHQISLARGGDPVIIRSSPTGGNFFAAVKSFAANIAISGYVVLTTKLE